METAIFIVASSGLVLFSRKSLFHPRVHGFYRFFAFECILILILLNVNGWFSDVWSAHQCTSWLLLCCSLVIAFHGFRLLRVVGRPSGNFENTTNLVKTGMYKYVRHPLYSSLLFLTWGVFMKGPSLAGALAAVLGTVLIVATARTEERENLSKFGLDYSSYMQGTKMFVPFIF